MSNRQKLVISLLKRVRQTSVRGAIEQMWAEDLLDKKALEADGLLEKYSKSKTTYRLTTSEIKED